jgi:PIN domain nuclease of toxin-antitoxin system
VQILLDTQCWLWMSLASGRFSRPTRELLLDPATDLVLSVASVWEIVLKAGLGKLRLPCTVDEFVPTRLETTRTRTLPVEAVHALHVATLPAHHRDPFDRMIVAQAQVERLKILSADAQLAAYAVELLAP